MALTDVVHSTQQYLHARHLYLGMVASKMIHPIGMLTSILIPGEKSARNILQMHQRQTRGWYR